MRCLGVVFGAIGLLLLLITGSLYLKEARFLGESELVAATVIKFNHGGLSSSPCSTPIFQFTTQEGQSLSVQGDTCSNPPANRVGDQVQVYYNPQDPEYVWNDDLLSLYAEPIGWGVTSAVFLLITLYLFIASFFPPKPGAVPRGGNHPPPGWTS